MERLQVDSDPTPEVPAARPEARLASALARLESRWGSAAIRLGTGDAVGLPARAALALVAAPEPTSLNPEPAAIRPEPAAIRPEPTSLNPEPAAIRPEPAAVSVASGTLRTASSPHFTDALATETVSTGFPALDAVLGPGGLPRQASAAIRGDVSSGKTTLALRCIAEAQGTGAIAGYLDLGRTFDPLEAVSRGVDLRWLIVLRPVDPSEGFALAGALLAGRTVDLLVVDLPARLPGRQEEALRRLSAHARRVGARLIVLEPRTLAPSLHAALAEATSVRLELDRLAWIRLGRDVVGQQTEVIVAKNRFGPPGRRVELAIHYADDGERAAAVRRFAAQTSAAAQPVLPAAMTAHAERLVEAVG